MATISRLSRNALGATRARQGQLGRHMFWVLAVSTALAALALFGAWSWRADDLASTAPHNARQPADAKAFDMGEPAALQTTPTPGR
ncbi:hypothetical protein [Phenylobacterium sp.]|uniref:hypothetical protein n=1 Tax=Phenylobacterium sp. TaxID=1871053 RepID=UPI0027348014|nr:hypothetical protein [Phenylobacterium sp.]MDP3852816.1 hypothetical protein [Phenylobacterium sp.]